MHTHVTFEHFVGLPSPVAMLTFDTLIKFVRLKICVIHVPQAKRSETFKILKFCKKK